MQNRLSSFINDKRGVSEEFTSLPALVVVMIGFAIFFAMTAGVYYHHNERVKGIDKYEVANFVLEKLVSPDGVLAERGLILEGGIVNKVKFDEIGKNPTEIEKIIEESNLMGLNFGLKLVFWKEESMYRTEWINIPDDSNKVAASKQVSVYLNDAEVVPGVLTVVVWGE